MATHLKNLSDYNPEEIPNAEDKIFGIVVSEWNTQVTGALLDGCLEAALMNLPLGHKNYF
jgi:6,7-dimethyl-8-ribityllumazine synthase